MLSRLTLKNFKAARSLSVELGELTLLAGLNGSGKSTVLQSLGVLRQSHQFGTGGSLVLTGPLVSLGQGSDVLSEGAEEDTISIDVVVDGESKHWECRAISDANELMFISRPQIMPSFLSPSNFQYLQADRIVPDTLYPMAGQQARLEGFLGAHGEFTADFLNREAKRPVPERRLCNKDNLQIEEGLWGQIAATHGLLDQVAGWLQHISPGIHLSAETLKGLDQVQLQFRYLGSAQGRTAYYRPTNVGFGLTYSLPIITACLSARSGSLLLLENPEAHLHPNGQIKMGQLLGQCAADGVQIMVETHSDHILNGIRLAVKAKMLTPSQVSLNYFTRELTTGDCYTENPVLLENGDISNWPNGFFDQWEKSLDALIS